MLETYLTLSFALQIIATVTTLLSVWLMGDKSIWGPIMGMTSTIAWIGIIILTNLWGLLFLNIVLFIINARNLLLWLK